MKTWKGSLDDENKWKEVTQLWSWQVTVTVLSAVVHFCYWIHVHSRLTAGFIKYLSNPQIISSKSAHLSQFSCPIILPFSWKDNTGMSSYHAVVRRLFALFIRTCFCALLLSNGNAPEGMREVTLSRTCCCCCCFFFFFFFFLVYWNKLTIMRAHIVWSLMLSCLQMHWNRLSLIRLRDSCSAVLIRPGTMFVNYMW